VRPPAAARHQSLRRGLADEAAYPCSATVTVPAKARVFVHATVLLGACVLAAAVLQVDTSSPATIALLCVAVLLTELLQVSSDEETLDPSDAQTFSFSSGVHVATILLVGPWAAAIVAAFGVLVVDWLRGSPRIKIVFNASVFAIAACAGGLAFHAAGGESGSLTLPADLIPVAALVTTYAVLNRLLVATVVSLFTAAPIWPQITSSAGAEAFAAAAEAGLGITLAVVVDAAPWAAIALVPLAVAVYQSRARLAQLRRETARALETFANIVDERDPYTYHHSSRVAESVRRLAAGVGLPPNTVARLRWAGRLHDLGKVAVDAAVLRKDGALDADEWAAMRRHPRLSARLLRRFRFAAAEARAVEFHHERFDGDGYYGLARETVPLASHFLIVADSYDAMTTDRPYRRALGRDEALARIESGIGTQFHPSVARAFVALERGADPISALAPEELAELRSLATTRSAVRGRVRAYRGHGVEALILGGSMGALAAAAIDYVLALPLLLVAVVGVGARLRQRGRAHRLATSIRAALTELPARQPHFYAVVEQIAATADLHWAALVSWREAELRGSTELAWPSVSDGPSEDALTSWLIREAEAREDILAAEGVDLGREGAHVAVPLRQDAVVLGFLVLGFRRGFPRHVELALRACVENVTPMITQASRSSDVVDHPAAAVF
jgi:HD-GYP domain-containing protein (c-di-GMP phosphodiesterase class II)/diacylglycerol kinase